MQQIDWRTRNEKTQDRILQMYPAVEEIWSERSEGRGPASWWVYLKPGWINNATETHSIHEDTIREVEMQLRKCIVKCDCDRCSEVNT